MQELNGIIKETGGRNRAAKRRKNGVEKNAQQK